MAALHVGSVRFGAARLCQVVLFAVLIAATVVGARVTSETFTFLEQHGNDEAVVLFYRSGSARHREAVDLLEQLDESLSSWRSSLNFRMCDGDAADNRASFEKVGFTDETYWFTTTPASGIEKYQGPVNFESLEFHVKSKYLDYSPTDVEAFTTPEELYDTMDEEEGRPVFVKFFEQWCTHCKALAPTFARAATFFRDEVRFVEVECSKNDDNRNYCRDNNVNSYPVLLLLTGESKVKYESADRSLLGFEEFFAKNLPLYKRKVGADSPSESGSAKKRRRRRRKAKRSDTASTATADATETAGDKSATSGNGGSKQKQDDAEVDILRRRLAKLEVQMEELKRTVGNHAGQLTTAAESLKDVEHKVERLWSKHRSDL